MTDLAVKLSQLQDTWKNADVPKDAGESQIPDGTYNATVLRFDTFDSNKGDTWLVTEFQITHDDDFQGEVVKARHNLDGDERSIGWLKKHLLAMGMPELPERFEELPTKLHDLLDVPVEIYIKTSDKTDSQGVHYRNVYVNRSMGGPLRAPESDIPADRIPSGDDIDTRTDEEKEADSSLPF